MRQTKRPKKLIRVHFIKTEGTCTINIEITVNMAFELLVNVLLPIASNLMISFENILLYISQLQFYLASALVSILENL